MKQARLAPCFKGERDYIQGGDLFDGFVRLIAEEYALPESSDLKFSVHRLVRSNLNVLLRQQAAASRTKEDVATLTFSHQSIRWDLTAVEDASPISCRMPFDEPRIVSACGFDAPNQSVTIRSPLPFTNMETWVAMNKALLQRLFPEQKGKWLFVRTELDRYRAIDGYREVTLTLLHNFNFRLTKTSVLVDGVKRGFIYFSMR